MRQRDRIELDVYCILCVSPVRVDEYVQFRINYSLLCSMIVDTLMLTPFNLVRNTLNETR